MVNDDPSHRAFRGSIPREIADDLDIRRAGLPLRVCSDSLYTDATSSPNKT